MSEIIRQNFLRQACRYLFGQNPPVRPQTGGACLFSC